MDTTHNPLILFGGAERDRTVGLQSAILALSQLSYCPVINDAQRRGLSLKVKTYVWATEIFPPIL